MSEPRKGLGRRFARDWLLPQWRWFLLGGILSAIFAAAIAGYAAMLVLAGQYLRDNDPRIFVQVPLAFIGLAVIRSIALYGQSQANNHGVQNAMIAIQERLFGTLIEGDFARLQAAASGEYVSQFANDMTLLREASLRVATNFAKSTFTIISCVATMLWLDWQVALLLLVAYPIAFWPVVRLGDRIRKVSRRAQVQAGELTAFLSETIQGARTVKAYGLEDFQKLEAHKSFVERSRLYMKVLRAKSIVDPLLEVFGGLAVGGLFAFAGYRALSGQFDIEHLIAFIAAVAAASPEVRALGTLNSAVNEGLAAADRLYAQIDTRPLIADRPDARSLGRARGRVEFSDVGFAYAGGGPTLNGLNFTAEPGQTVALVGPSGAGKSTVFNLLLRLYDPAAGAILIDGHDIREVRLASLRRNIALVSQDAFLFDTTVRENIALGRPGASDADIKAAAQAAACDFIDQLPGGWNAPAGEGGRNLSGGQRQRIALARALLSDAPVLLLDEATSALDSASEAKVQAALAALAGTRTIIVIAHRLATVRRASRIFVMDQGRIVEAGAHDDLVARRGPYAELASHQLS